MKILQDTDVVRGGCSNVHPPLTTLLMQIKKQRPLVASLGIDETKKVFGQFITALSFSSSLLRFRADSEGGERLFIPKREGECVHSVSGVAVLCDGRRALDRRFQTGCLQLYPLPPCRVSEPHLKAAEEENGGEGGDKHPRYKICNPRKLTNLTVSACRPPSGLVCVNLSTNSGSEWVTDAVHVSTGL